MPRIARISIDYARFSEFEQEPPRDVLPLNSREFVRYCLINRDLPNLNHLNDPVYLAYEGGFITQGNRVNVKHSDFSIKGPSNSISSGNFLGKRSGFFYSNINMLSLSNVPQKAFNIKQMSSGQAGVNEIYGDIIEASGLNNDAITIGDYKRFLYVPGMITLYNGTLQNLRSNMPFWRFCGPPDAGQSVEVTYPNGDEDTIIIPNLFSKFLPGAQPSDNHTATGTYDYKTGDTDGYDAIRVSISEMATHNHNVQFSFDSQDPVLTGVTSFAHTGGDLNFGRSRYAHCTFTSSRPFIEDFACTASNCANDGIDVRKHDGGTSCTRKCKQDGCDSTSSSVEDVLNVLTSVSITSYTRRTITPSYDPARITSQTEENRGGTAAHENRPKYYGLIPIIYVGRPRT